MYEPSVCILTNHLIECRSFSDELKEFVDVIYECGSIYHGFSYQIFIYFAGKLKMVYKTNAVEFYKLWEKVKESLNTKGRELKRKRNSSEHLNMNI